MRVLYEDNHIIVVIKPVNVPSQEDKTGDRDMLTMIKEYVKEKYEKPGNVYIDWIDLLAELWFLLEHQKRLQDLVKK